MNFISTFDELNKLYEEVQEELDEACDKNELTEEADEDEEIEIVDDEAPVAEVPAEEPTAEDEPRKLIRECSNCGAITIKDEDKVAIDEESDLVDVEDECEFCEETKGYKIVGVVAPYDVEDASEEPDVVTPVEDFVDEPAEVADVLEETDPVEA